MGERGREVLALVERPWVELTPPEREQLREYVRGLLDGPNGDLDLYMWLRHARRRWRRGRTASGTTLAALIDSDPSELEPD